MGAEKAVPLDCPFPLTALTNFCGCALRVAKCSGTNPRRFVTPASYSLPSTSISRRVLATTLSRSAIAVQLVAGFCGGHRCNTHKPGREDHLRGQEVFAQVSPSLWVRICPETFTPRF